MRIPNFFNFIFPNQIWSLPQSQKTVYLTFDDGPIPDVTPWLLDLLKEKGIKASFFCIGDNIRKHPEIFSRIIEEGHTVGNHTFNHINGWKNTSDNYIQNTLKCNEEIEKHIKLKRKLFRPPYGRITPKQIKKLKQEGYEIIMWEILSHDYNNHLSAQECYINVTKKVRSGSIIVFHDSIKAQKNLKDSLPLTIDTLLKENYIFNTL